LLIFYVLIKEVRTGHHLGGEIFVKTLKLVYIVQTSVPDP
jgi:hypothetical protein